jgi:peptide/nickel transport system substrate-binding protein
MLRNEKLLFGIFLSLFLIGGAWWGARFWFENTIIAPAVGGKFSEAFVGDPRHINPVLIDRVESEGAIETMVFSSLFKTDTKGGIIPDLAESYTISENRREYFVTLRENTKWHDGAEVTVNDVLFTLSLIQDPFIRSPLAFAWQGVEAEKISTKTVKFTLNEPYEYFMQNLTFRIMPQHLWAQVPLENFHLAELNLRPIGSGPYRFHSFERDPLGNIMSYALSANPEYFKPGPYIETIRLRFYKTREDALFAWKKGDVDTIGGIDPIEHLNANGSRVKQIATTRQFNVFFNTDNRILADGRVRQALIAAVDREAFALNILGAAGKMLENGAQYNPEEAGRLFTAAGWRNLNEEGVLTRGRGRNRITLSLELTVPAGVMHQRTAEFLTESWKKVGVDARIASLDAPAISSVIRERNYDMILFGTLFGTEPDLFPFWHSSQINHPGLNLSRLEIRRLDTLLERSRREINPENRAELRSRAMEIIHGSHSALFLYSPYYFYAMSPKILLGEANPEIIGAPEERFNRIDEWFTRTKRIWRR